MTLDHQRAKSNNAISAYETEVRSAFVDYQEAYYPYEREVRSDFGGYYQEAHYPYERKDYEDYGVLGLPSITSGKHYWEVDVSQKHAWILGVCVGKYPSSIRMDFGKQGKNNQPVCSRYQPKNGYWVIGLQDSSKYQAFVNSPSSKPSSLTLFLKVPPHRIGVFLDYNACTISFLNITNHGFLIYEFSSCLFNKEIYPYFNPMKCSDSLKLCSPSS